MSMIVFLKSHVKGHMRAGKWVSDYDNKVAKKPESKWFSGYHSAPAPKPKAFHPKLNDDGKQVGLIDPHDPTPSTTWDNPEAVATFVPGGNAPATLHGIPLTPWDDAPQTLFDWANVDGQDVHDEPEMDEEGFHKIGAGVVVMEPDGRVWIIHPSNKYGGYKASFPKGTVEDGLPLQASAIKEAYEESGLKVELTGFLMDVDRTTSRARYYTAKRVGGTPTDAGWESQAVSLAPVKDLYSLLNMSTDHGIAEALGAGPKPKPPQKTLFNASQTKLDF